MASAAKKAAPFVVGLTGGIGMGKSAVASHFRSFGFPVYDSDAAVHELYSPGGKATAAVAARWGSEAVLGQNGGVDRTRLWHMIQESPAVLKELEAIVHPLVAEHREEFLARNADAFLAVVDVPLLFETGMEAQCDTVVVASAIDPAIQRSRVLRREGMTEEKLDQILAKQMPDATKRERADHIINTSDVSMSPLRHQVAMVVKGLVGGRQKEFLEWVSPHPTTPIGVPKVVALDLDDTIWDTDQWINEMPGLVEPVIAEHLPKAYAAGTRYRDPQLLQTIASLRKSVPGIAHDHAELRRRAYLAAASEAGDDVDGVDVVSATYLQTRSEAAFRHLYADTVPFLTEIRKRGVLIAAISDGNGDVTRSPILNPLFDFSVSAVSAGVDKGEVGQFLQLLTQGRELLGQPLVAQEVMVIGDNFSKDVLGAVNCGMRAAWLRREGGIPRGELHGTEEDYCTQHNVPIIDGLHADKVMVPPPTTRPSLSPTPRM